MAFARCIGSWIDNDSLEDAHILGTPLRRLRPKSKTVLHAALFDGSVDCFVFDFGCVVLWGCSRPQLARAVEAVLPWTDEPRARPTEDRVLYRPASERIAEIDRHLSCIIGDTIYLSTESVLEKLGYSYALAQGVLLDVFEAGLAARVDAVGDVPATLAETGNVPLTERQASLRLGEVFLLQYEVNLGSDLLESPPDTFWDLDPLAPVYRLCRSYLDVDRRLAVLNCRLGFMRNMYSMFQSEAHVRSSSVLGWVITLGVAGEVLVAALQMLLMIYRFHYNIRV
jgi:uncharacterized Rmd1/YagE family protein